jgi:hypothetical protein
MIILRGFRSFGRFLYDFVVGDEPLIAIGVVLALAATAVLSRSDGGGWWVTVAAVPVVLAVSLVRSIRRSEPPGPRDA